MPNIEDYDGCILENIQFYNCKQNPFQITPVLGYDKTIIFNSCDTLRSSLKKVAGYRIGNSGVLHFVYCMLI